MMQLGAVVLARMNSERFPGKVMHEVGGKPLLQYLLERLSCCRLLSTVVVATSRTEADQPIEDLCRRLNFPCYRGSLLNVAGRVMAAASTFGLDGFVRVCGDSPLLDQRLVDRGAGIFRSGAYDLVTNVFPRTFPPGQSVEVMSTAFFRRGYALMSEAGDLEHVTRFFYRHNHRFNILNFSAPEDYSGLHLAVDTAEDMQRFAGLVASMARPHWHYGLPEIVRLYRQVETNNEDGQEK